MKKSAKYVFLFGVGGVLYNLLEILFRGWSHWTMFILGGVCFVCIGLINELIPWCTPLWKQMLIGMAIITYFEFITGCVVNIWLGWDVWDYSNLPGNVLGQICPQFSLLWFWISALGIILDDWLRYRLFGEDRPHYIFL
ncbi:putative ABC transporter permease [Clostridium sp. Marseille-P2415]|uniref:putative ABC transporter permease n=1 Tax=Clostridium sp. Marseille-P2415 TaxID=1805471 RepID=UPI00098839C9|nr:hypothetical protein [Clostridium sp. Marseille-P2415]